MNIHQKNYHLIVGDALALALVTWIGFASHGEADPSFLPRMLITYIPLLLGWFLLSPWFHLFKTEESNLLSQLWRIFFAMLFVAPFAATARGFLLNTSIVPIFVVVLVFSNAIGITVWRILYLVILRFK